MKKSSASTQSRLCPALKRIASTCDTTTSQCSLRTSTTSINEAAMPGSGLSWSDFELYSSCNLSSVARLMDQAKRWPLTKFVQISTSSVYGKNAVGDENMPTLPVSPYGVTKLAAENLAFAYMRDSDVPVTVLRYFSVYGPGQRPDMAYRKFIAKRSCRVRLSTSMERAISPGPTPSLTTASLARFRHSNSGRDWRGL